MIARAHTETVGRTPMVELGRVAAGLPGRILGKLEMRNPCGSVKDRLGVALIEDAERRGVLPAGGTIVEATGGNTGIGLAFAAAIRGYRLILTMPSSMSTERVALLRHLGAEVILTPGILMTDALARAGQIVRETPGAVLIDQSRNPANPEMHRRTTALEIWDDTGGSVDVFVSAVGTGGTITGVGEVLKATRRSPSRPARSRRVRRSSCSSRTRASAPSRRRSSRPSKADRTGERLQRIVRFEKYPSVSRPVQSARAPSVSPCFRSFTISTG